MTYRKDIDGLRAIAVLSVILYHLGFSFISGGFIGVDIFFVISGFLITQSIQHDLEKNRFTIKNFYIKRIRRIIPVLFVTTMVTMIIAPIVLPIEALKEFALSVLSVSFFSSNIFFWQHIDYFSVSAELKPLLHTWSLGIEEQFYIFFPLFMMWTAKWRTSKLFIVTIIFTFLSFALCVSPMGTSHIQANFFLPITRFWELFFGVLLALFLSKSRKIKSTERMDNILAFLGLGLIVAPLLLLDYNSIFPSINALYPVLGAVLIIYSGREGKTFLAHILSNGVIRYIGLISFSLYLWHWTIIAFSKNIIAGEFTSIQQLEMLALMSILSILSFHFVETPFRKVEKFREFLKIKNGVLALMILAISSLTLFLFLKLFYPDNHLQHKDINCFKTEASMQSIDECTFGDKESNRTFVLYGDSHASAIYPAFEKYAKEQKMKGVFISLSGCPPLFGVKRDDGVGNASNCTGEYARNIDKFLKGNANEIEHLYLVARWTMYEKGWILNGRLQKATHFLSNDTIKTKTAQESATVLKKGLEDTVKKITKEFKIPLTIFKNPPTLHGDIGKRGLKDVTKEEYQKELKYTDGVFELLKRDNRFELISPIEVLCPTSNCLRYEGNRPLYRDDNHLNHDGAMKLYPLLLKNKKLEKN